jgi:hypothetical protein
VIETISLDVVDDPQIPASHKGQDMFRITIALFLLFAAQEANAAECGSTANRAGCVGPNGAASYNKHTGEVHTAQPYHSNEVAPATNVQGRRGNSATKAMEPGCAFVNGRRVCN